MKQHSIDLLPDSIRARSQAGVRTGRYITSAVVSIILVVVATTHVCLQLDRARGERASAREQADLVLAAEEKASELEGMIEEVEGFIERYRRIAPPLEINRLLATAINAMPEGLTLDRVDLDAGARRITRSPRDKGPVDPDAAPPRVLTAEIAGFAPDDRAIAEFVSRLEGTEPFRQVSLDFSRTRDVRGRTAREFRLSFRINFEADYEPARADAPPAPATELALEETDHE
ncbi:MAG: PilN domain-containing protein [Planctomycetota bacterium]|nr:PilN domain-containing protein [Planctomycetota bacterium]